MPGRHNLSQRHSPSAQATKSYGSVRAVVAAAAAEVVVVAAAVQVAEVAAQVVVEAGMLMQFARAADKIQVNALTLESRSGGLGSPTSNTGGRTTTGSGTPPRYGGGAYYGGGATVPYKAGDKRGSIAPALLTGAAIGGIGFLGVSYLYGAYAYPYYNHYYYHNVTTNMNETKPVICVCDPYNPCTCEDNGNQTYFSSVIGNGSYDGLNHTLVSVAKNDTTGNLTIYINGAVDNGTTAAGGTEDPDSAANSMVALAQAAGWWPAATMAFAIAFLT